MLSVVPKVISFTPGAPYSRIQTLDKHADPMDVRKHLEQYIQRQARLAPQPRDYIDRGTLFEPTRPSSDTEMEVEPDTMDQFVSLLHCCIEATRATQQP